MRGQTSRSILGGKLQRALRKTMTDAERVLWHAINRNQIDGHKFRRQHPFLDYVLDFVCLEKWLVLEVDGGQHMDSLADTQRDERLRNAGFQILRFWNNDVLNNLEGVVETIHIALKTQPYPHPNPSTVGFAQPTGSSGAEQCSAKPHFGPLEGENQPHPHPNPPLEGEGVNSGADKC